MKGNFLSLFFSLFFIFQYSFAQGQSYSSAHKGPFEPPFEKIYLEPSEIVTLPDGVYYEDESGTLCKARALRWDYDGMYVIHMKPQCSLCGRCYEGTFLDEEYGCPHFQRKLSPKLFVD